IRDADLRADLTTITAPTLVISGADDPSTPPAQLQAIAAGIPNSRLLELADCAHMATIDQADEVTAALVEHFSAGGRSG
ncbi:MAG: alpha/beta hydrolase, partial [Actinomycetota bacterium]|nr:alpha/beta hydrolase [Actinomycetota bacterium]